MRMDEHNLYNYVFIINSYCLNKLLLKVLVHNKMSNITRKLLNMYCY